MELTMIKYHGIASLRIVLLIVTDDALRGEHQRSLFVAIHRHGGVELSWVNCVGVVEGYL